jgi:hypothetical protein
MGAVMRFLLLALLGLPLAAAPAAAQPACSGTLTAQNNLAGVCSKSAARDNLELGSVATQDADAIAVTGGTATGLTGLGMTSTGAFYGASGTTAERPTATAGGLRFNSTTGFPEYSNGSLWTSFGTGGTVTSVAAGAGMDFSTITATGSVAASANTLTTAIAFIIDGGGSAITTGVKGDIEIPFACTITAARLLADQSGSIVVDIWKDTYANFPPTDADSITASAPPTISSATKSEDTTLTGWTTSITAGNILRFNVDSVTSIQRVTVSLTCLKS